MKNIHNKGGHGAENLQENPVKRLLVLAAVGLRLGRKIYAKLQKVEDSLEILAAQKARELNPEKPTDVEAK